MNISVFGLGYVGAVTSSCLAQRCNSVIGVDVDERKLELIRLGRSPIVEEGLNELIGAMVKAGKISVTSDCAEAVKHSDLSIVCVGTPSRPNGSLDTTHVERVCQQIGEAIRQKGAYHSVVIRSTVLPGTTLGVVQPILEAATGGAMGEAFGLSMNPEFLREGTSIRDFDDPPYTIVGTECEGEFERVAKLFADIDRPIHHVSVHTAEAVKYACNLFHAVKITFANEIGAVCKGLGVDARAVMELVCQDQKLNISPRYLRPGFAFGGSCLPKDLRAFTYAGRQTDAAIPMLNGMLQSNRDQIEAVARRVMAHGCRRIALLGLSFKPGTDDLRESPLLSLAERLIGRGYDVRIADPSVKYAALHGANKRYIEQELPHLRRLLTSPRRAIIDADLIVVGHHTPEIMEALENLEDDQRVFDLVGVSDFTANEVKTDGLYW